MCLCITPAGASAVSFVEVQAEGTGGVAAGLADVSGVALSPDGTSLYTAGTLDNAIAAFQRSPATGRLLYEQSLKQGDPLGGSQGAVTGLDTPVRAVVGPRGQAVYTISAYGALAVFDRAPSTGRLTFRAALTPPSLAQARAIAVSPDGADLYVAGDDTGTNGAGMLVWIKPGAPTVPPALVGDAIKESLNGVAGLDNIADMAVSADGKYLYVSSTTDDAIAVFARDTGTGGLTYQQAYVDNRNGISGLKAPGQLALSPDGQYLYVAAGAANAIVIFRRDGGTGGLTFVQAFADGDQDAFGNTVSGLGGAYALAVSPEGSQLYAAGETGNTLAVFHRSPLSGRLTVADLLSDSQNGVKGLEAVLDLGVSPDGQSLYTAASVAGKVGVFAVAAADLNLVMTSNAKVANAGQQLQYSLVITNNGVGPATGATAYDDLPASLTFVRADSSQGTCGHNAGVVLCHLDRLAPGASAMVTLTVSASGTAAITNRAEAAADERDPRPADNVDSVTLTVNRPPVANDDTALTNLDMPVTIHVLSNDTDPDNDTLSITGYDGQSAHGGTVIKGYNGTTLTYTPPAAFTGQDTFHYTVSDGRGGQASAAVTVLINTPPIALDDSAATTAGTPITIYVLANDHDPEGDPIKIAAADNPSAKGGRVAINNGGTITYIPPSGFSGDDSFGYTIADSHGATSQATVSVAVQADAAGPSSGGSGGVSTSGAGSGNNNSAAGGGGALGWASLTVIGSLFFWPYRRRNAA